MTLNLGEVNLKMNWQIFNKYNINGDLILRLEFPVRKVDFFDKYNTNGGKYHMF